MAGDGTKVTLTDLQEHHGNVDEIMGELNTAVSAGGEAGALFTGAFGLVGQPCALIVQGWVSTARSAMDSVVSAGESISQNLKDTHEEYSNNEQKCKALFTDIHKGLS